MTARGAPQAGSTNMRSSSARSRGTECMRREKGKKKHLVLGRLWAPQIHEASQPASQLTIHHLPDPPSINLTTHPSIHPPFIYLSIHPFLYPSFGCLSVHPSVYPSINISISLSIHSSIIPIHHLTVCLSIH